MTDRTGLELRSLITSAGELTLSLEEVAVPDPGPGKVVVRIEASPLNPSDLGLLLGPADLSGMKASGTADRPVLTAPVPEGRLKHVAARLDQSMPVGNEGAGTVIAAGEGAEGLMGKRVAMLGGSMYAQYRTLPAAACLPLPDGATAAEGASAFVNPLTALSMVETMRAEGHKALIHTAAASNLGQMLNRICLADGVKLVNIVRKPEQAEILRGIGAEYICDSSEPDFEAKLADAIEATGATIAFDAIGGGKLAGQILAAMETALSKGMEYSRYGSSVRKQVYIYGSLDLGPTIIDRSFGLSWATGGYLLTNFLAAASPEVRDRMRNRVAVELTTTFASHYAGELSLAEALDPAMVETYQRKATGVKYLITPAKGL